MPISLRKLVDTKLAQRKITPDDAREVLRAVEKDGKFTAAEVKQLERLTALPGRRFSRPDEYIPNPLMADDGVTIKANPKAWLEGTVKMASATLNVRATIPEVSLKLKPAKEYSWDDLEDFGTHWARPLEVSVQGERASRDGTVSFTYANRAVSVPVKKGEAMEQVMDKLYAALDRAEPGRLQVHDFYRPNVAGKQTVTFEVL